MTKEKFETSLERLEGRRDRDIDRYHKSEMKKVFGFIALEAIICVTAFVVAAIAIFHLWNYFNPTQDYLYFIVLYCMFGSIVNMFILAFAEDRYKKYIERKKRDMKFRERQINRYYDYMRDEQIYNYQLTTDRNYRYEGRKECQILDFNIKQINDQVPTGTDET